MTVQQSRSAVNTTAFLGTTGLALATAGSVIVAAKTASTVAAVAYGAFAVLGAALSISLVTAWLDPKSNSVGALFDNWTQHAQVAIGGMFQLVAQTFTLALVEGAAKGIGRAIARKIGGDDVTVGVRAS